MTKKTWKIIIVTTSVSLLIFTATISYHNLVYTCDTKKVDFGLDGGTIETKSLKETNLTIDFSVTESTVEGYKMQEINSFYRGGYVFEDLIRDYTRSNCLLSNSPNLELKINPNKNQIKTSPLFIDNNCPLRIDFFWQKRVYNFQARAKKEVETMLADYKLYKYEKVWVFQNDMPSMQEGRVNNYQKNTLGKFLSFDQGQSWIYINRESFPETIFEDSYVNKQEPKNPSSIEQDKFRYKMIKTSTNLPIIYSLYQILEEKEELEPVPNKNVKDVFTRVEENDITRYFIVDAGFVGSYKNEKSNQEVPVYWYQIESLDGKYIKKWTSCLLFSKPNWYKQPSNYNY